MRDRNYHQNFHEITKDLKSKDGVILPFMQFNTKMLFARKDISAVTEETLGVFVCGDTNYDIRICIYI